MKQWFNTEATASFANELGVITRRANRTWVTRVGSFVLISGLLAINAPNTWLYAYMALLIPFEVTLQLRGRMYQSRVGRIKRKHAAVFALHEFLITSFYVGLGFFSLGSNSISAQLLGFVWMAGCLNYARINFVHWQHLDFLHIVPSTVGLVFFTALMGHSPVEASSTFAWLSGIGAGILFVITNLELATDQRRVGRQLLAAQKEAAERLEALEFSATHDDLTGLLNRSAFNSRLEQLLEKATEDGGQFSVLLLDLDGFKPVNDAFGHPSGDALLSEVSGRLRNTIGGSGSVARVGGDEFGIILSSVSSPDELEDISRNLIRVVGLPVKFQDVDLSVGVSIGAAIYTRELNSSEKLISAADEALYLAKGANKSSFNLFHPGQARKRIPIEERSTIENAIKQRLIKPYYQPKFCLKSRKVVGFEALARWPLNPDQPCDTADFVAKIEQMGLLGEFTYHMAKQVFTDINDLLDQGYDPGQVSLNLSEVTLATMNGLEDLEWLLAENARAVPHVTLEITEDVFIARAGSTIRENIDALRQIGARISLDDFGTGFASFQHLRQLEFDELKIDTEFVRGLGIDPTANVIVDGFLSIAQGLGVSVVAEGVETEAQRKYLLERGCPVGQGFLHSKAQPINKAKKYLERPKGSKAAS